MTTDHVARARAGDHAAIEEIWRAYQPGLLRYLRSLGIDGAQDVASVVWIELTGALRKIGDDEPTTLRRMLYTVARRRMIDEFRRRERRSEMATADPAVFDVEGAPDQSLAAALDLLRLLPPSQAEVIALRTIVGMSAREVGEVTGQTPAAVRVMAHRGLATLREILTARAAPEEELLGSVDHTGDAPVTNPSLAAMNPVR